MRQYRLEMPGRPDGKRTAGQEDGRRTAGRPQDGRRTGPGTDTGRCFSFQEARADARATPSGAERLFLPPGERGAGCAQAAVRRRRAPGRSAEAVWARMRAVLWRRRLRRRRDWRLSAKLWGANGIRW